MHWRGALVFAATLIAATSGARGATPEGAGSDANAEIERALDRKVSFEFNNTPLSEALQFLQTLTRTSVVVDPRMPRAKGRTAVTLKVSDVPLRDAVERILSPVGLAWAVRNEALYIHEKGAPETEVARPKLSKVLEDRLAKKVTFEFVETPLTEAVRFLGQLSGVTIDLPNAVAHKKGHTPITLKVTNMPLRLAIDWILRLGDCTYEQRGDGLVCVLPPDAGKAPPARRVQVAKPVPAFPAVMVVVESAKASERKAARELLAFLTRGRQPDGDFSKSAFGPFRLVPAASVAAAQKAAGKAVAFGILRVIITRRAAEIRMRGEHAIDTTCAVYTFASSAARTKPKWKLKATRRISYSPNRDRSRLQTVSRGDFAWSRDNLDFAIIAVDIAALVRDTAVELKKPRLAKAPGGGLRLDVEVTNNTRHVISGLRVEFGANAKVPGEYSGDPLPPGKKRVTVTIVKGDAWRLRRNDLAPKLLSVEFREAAAKE